MAEAKKGISQEEMAKVEALTDQLKSTATDLGEEIGSYMRRMTGEQLEEFERKQTAKLPESERREMSKDAEASTQPAGDNILATFAQNIGEILTVAQKKPLSEMSPDEARTALTTYLEAANTMMNLTTAAATQAVAQQRAAREERMKNDPRLKMGMYL